VAGVALATVCAQLASAVAVLWLLFDPGGEYRMKVRELRFHKVELGKIMTLGLPCGLNSIVYSISNVLVQSAINTFPAAVVAGSTTGSSVGDFVYLIITSLSTACVTFSGQCFGAGKYRRIDKLLITSTVLACTGILACALGLTFFGRPILGLYTRSPETVEAAQVKLMVLAWSYSLLAVSDLCLCCMRGLGKSAAPTMVNVTTVCVSRMGWVLFIFPLLRAPWFLYLCYPVSWISSAVPQLILYCYYRKKLSKGENDL
jgi:Na+-driven multidrug efflux pump